nr:MAG TPA: hypothetical protein [Bacteriophage sp.]
MRIWSRSTISRGKNFYRAAAAQSVKQKPEA